MGSGAGAVQETVDALCRPASGSASRSSACTDRSRPLRCSARSAAEHADRGRARPHQGARRAVRAAAPRRAVAMWHSPADHWADGAHPRVIGGRYGLSSKEFTPAMVKAVFDEAAEDVAAQRVHRRDHRRRHPHQPRRSTRLHDRSRPGPRRVLRPRLPTARSARTRTPPRSSARTPTCSCRPTSSTTRRSRDR